MKILVTGATGFVGRALVDRLLANGEHVLAGVRKESRNLPDSVQQLVTGDLSVLDQTSLALKHTAFEGIETVIHTAARVHIMNDDAVDLLEAFRKVNRDATLILARMAAKSGVKRFEGKGVRSYITIFILVTKMYLPLDNKQFDGFGLVKYCCALVVSRHK